MFANNNQGFFNEQGQDSGEFLNNAAGEEFSPEEGALNEGLAENTAVNEFSEEILPDEPFAADADAGLTDEYAGDDALQSVPTDAPAFDAGMLGGGRVLYVQTSSLEGYSSPDGTEVTTTLSEGDHPVIYQEENWGRTSDGVYFPLEGLTEQPVGRPPRPAFWQ